MDIIHNISLYIKRAESHHTKDFITRAFASNNIGKVRDVKFIQKTSDYGKDYNGAIVIFEHWNMNPIVTQLLDNMNSSLDGTTKFTFDPINNRYWFIHVYKNHFPEYEEITTVDPNLPDKERIKELEILVKSMTAQIHYMQIRQEKSEKQMMDFEHKHTQSWLYNLELKAQNEDKYMEIKWLEDDLEKSYEENNILRSRLVIQEINSIQKEKECEYLTQCLHDEKSILNFVEQEANEMRLIIKNINY